MKQVKRRDTAFGVTGAVICLLSLYPFMVGIITMGAILPFGVGLLLIGMGLFREKLIVSRAGRIIDRVIWILFGIGLFLFLLLSLLMCFGVRRTGAVTDQTVVVLGCKVNGDEPSLMLARRLDTAYDLLVENPKLTCVVSGGQGEDESHTEASVMKRYLVQKGIDTTRIYEENQSLNTLQNLENSKKVIEKNRLNSNIILVTDFFHQYRAQLYADRVGLRSTASSCSTKLDLLPFYWIRETAGVAKAILGG